MVKELKRKQANKKISGFWHWKNLLFWGPTILADSKKEIAWNRVGDRLSIGICLSRLQIDVQLIVFYGESAFRCLLLTIFSTSGQPPIVLPAILSRSTPGVPFHFTWPKSHKIMHEKWNPIPNIVCVCALATRRIQWVRVHGRPNALRIVLSRIRFFALIDA